MADVVSIAHPRRDPATDRAAPLDIGLDVSEQLAGMMPVCERVDDGHSGAGGKALDFGMFMRTDCDYIDHARDDARGIFDRLAPPELQVIRRQKHGGATEFRHSRFKGDSRPGRRLVEYEGKCPVFQGGMYGAGEAHAFELDATKDKALKFRGRAVA